MNARQLLVLLLRSAALLVAAAVVAATAMAGLRRAPAALAPAPEVAVAPPPADVVRRATGRPVGDVTAWEIPTSDGLLMLPAVQADGSVWAGEMGDRQLTLLVPASGRYTRLAFPGAEGAQTHAVAVAPDGRVWLALDGRHAVAVYDPELRAFQEWPTPTAGSSPFGLTIAGDGRVWFTEMTGDRIGVFDPATEQFHEYPLPRAGLAPYLLVETPDGRIWFTTLRSATVGVLDPATGAVDLLSLPGVRRTTGTTGIATGGDGAVWFGVRGGQLGRVDPATHAVDVLRSPAPDSYGIAVDRAGRVWLAGTGRAVYAYKPEQARFCEVRTGDGARWLTVAPDGSIWLTQGHDATNAFARVTAARAADPCAAGSRQSRVQSLTS
jgi:virginiamycin B lyase